MMKMMMTALVLTIAAPAAAKTTFAAYDGPGAEQTGTGGTHQNMKGIELWTMGAPARRFKMIGIITDQRKDRLLDGDPTDSPAVAKKAREAGGDAVILLGQDSRPIGYAGGANAWSDGTSTFASGQGRLVSQRVTRFAVIRYMAQ